MYFFKIKITYKSFASYLFYFQQYLLLVLENIIRKIWNFIAQNIIVKYNKFLDLK